MNRNSSIPAVISLAGLDPTGGAGLQADIEALASQGCHACPVLTTATVQDTHDVKQLMPLSASDIIAQARCILEDIPVAAFKLGLLGSVEIIEAIHTLLTDYPDIPVVLDPVLASGSGTSLGSEDIVNAMLSLLLPLTTIITPNTPEARKLAPEADTLDACALALLDKGAEFVLLTGTHEQTSQVENRLYSDQRLLETYHWKRLAGSFHGSGCTLAASLAGLLAQGIDPLQATHQAQEYTWQSLEQAYAIGMGQFIPNRLFWAQQ